jgi:hypothetical protein
MRRGKTKLGGVGTDSRSVVNRDDVSCPAHDRSRSPRLLLVSCRGYPLTVAGELSRPWLERPAPTHPLLEQLADSQSFVGVQGPEEVLTVVFWAYRTAAAGRDWDPSAGTTTLDAATVQACARLGRLIWLAGASDFEHGVQPGPVFGFDGGTIGVDLRFGDPDDDGRAVDAIAEGFEELGCTLGGAGGAPIISGAS